MNAASDSFLTRSIRLRRSGFHRFQRLSARLSRLDGVRPRMFSALCLGVLISGAAVAEPALVLPRDINFEDNSASPEFLTDAGGAVYFSASRTVASDAGGFINEKRLWVSDGSEQGTQSLSGLPVNTITARDPEHLTALNGTLYFSARTFDESTNPAGMVGRELWRTDGTPASTVMVADLNPGSASANPNNLVAVGEYLFFAASTNNGAGRELWMSDGLPGGSTAMVKDINPGSASSIGAIATATNVNGTLFFWANDGIHGFELWKSDGTASGTQMVKDINPATEASSIAFDPNPGTIIGSRVHRSFNPVAIGAALYFIADDGVHGAELWRSDGSAENTVMVADINPSAGSNPAWLIDVNGTLFFIADDGATGRELWKTRSTVEGDSATRVADIRQGADSSRDANHDQMVTIGDSLYFAANNGFNGTALWRSDGSAAGTVMVADLHPGTDGLAPLNKLTRVGNGFYFAADDGVAGVELWYSDGTDGGTRLASDINSGADGSIGLVTGPRPIDLVASGGRLFVPAFEPTQGDELWVTAAGAPDGFDDTRTRPLDAPPPDPPPGADIGVLLTLRAAGGAVPSGSLFVVKGAYYNLGPAMTAYGVQLRSGIGAGGGHFSSSVLCIPPANPGGPPAIVSCPLGNLPKGVVRKVVFLGLAPEVSAPTAMGLSHAVQHAGVDPRGGNNQSMFTATVVPPPPPVAGVDLEVILLDQLDPVLPGAGIEYRTTVLNRGPDQASGVVIQQRLPPQVQLQSVNSSPAGVCSESGGLVTCLLSTLSKNAFATIDVNARAPLARLGVISTVSVSSDQVDTDDSNNSDEESTSINESFFIFADGFEGG